MSYYQRSLWILALFNIFVGVIRIVKSVLTSTGGAGSIPVIFIRSLTMFMMGVVLIMITCGVIKIRQAAITAYILMGLYIWLAFEGTNLNHDTIVNIGVMLIIFSTISVHRCYREDAHRCRMENRPPVELDLHISGAEQLFHPMIIGPHLEISTEVTDAVDRFFTAEKEMAPLELNIYSNKSISKQLQRTAKEAFKEHYRDEEKHINRVLMNRTRRSNILFCISMSIMFIWVRYNNIVGASPVWTILGNMGGFFLWEIGNTHLRHIEEYLELERVVLLKNADITFIC